MRHVAIVAAVLPAIVLLAGRGSNGAEVREESISLAKSTLSEKLKASESDFELLATEPIEWSSDTAGCRPAAEAGQKPITSGYKVRLGYKGSAFTVHVGGGKAKVCGFEPATPPITRGSVDPQLEDLTEQAKQDLAARLEIPLERIQVLEAVTVVWRDSSAGCPKRGMNYLQVLTPGTRIRLQTGKETYQYHSAVDNAPFLCEHPSPVEPLPTAVK